MLFESPSVPYQIRALRPRLRTCRWGGVFRGRRLSAPAGSGAAGVDVDEGAVRAVGRVDPDATGELGMFALDGFGGASQDPGVFQVHPAVAVQVVHAPFAVVVGIHVGGIAVLMARDGGAPSRTNALLVVFGSAETAHHEETTDGVPLAAKLLDRQLQLVQETRLKDHVLGPDRKLVLGDELAQREMFGQMAREILPSHFHKSLRVGVDGAGRLALLVRPVAEPVGADAPVDLGGKGYERNPPGGVPRRDSLI